MTTRLLNLTLLICAGTALGTNASAQTTGEARPKETAAACTTITNATADALVASVPNAGIPRASAAAYSATAAKRRFSSLLTQERTTMGQVVDAHLDLYPSTEFLRILASPNRPAVVPAPFRSRLRVEAVSSTMPGVPSATAARLYHSDSSVGAVASWYSREYGFDFKTHIMPLGDASGTDTLTVARAVKRVQNSVVTVMIWNPSSSARRQGGMNAALNTRTSVEIQERAFRPRADLIAEGPDAAVELTWKVPYRDLIQRVSMKYQIDPHLVAALVQQESNFNANAMSVDSAMGLTQMIPGTAEMLGVTDPTNPRQALEGGVRYLKMLLRKFNGNVEFALAGYNAGPGNVQKYGGIPPFAETRDYVRRIIARYKEKAAGAFASSAKIVRAKL